MEETREDISNQDLEGTSYESSQDETLKREEGDTRKYRLWKLKLKRTKIIRAKSQMWFMWICLSLNLVPRTLQLANKDPKESDKEAYMEKMKEE